MIWATLNSLQQASTHALILPPISGKREVARITGMRHIDMDSGGCWAIWATLNPLASLATLSPLAGRRHCTYRDLVAARTIQGSDHKGGGGGEGADTMGHIIPLGRG